MNEMSMPQVQKNSKDPHGEFTDSLTPKQIVAELDKFIVGQNNAKRAVAIALRNRWRRQQLPESLRDEVGPKNILMIGPTGVGKTENSPAARQTSKITLHQGGSFQIYRSGVCRPRCRIYGSRSCRA